MENPPISRMRRLLVRRKIRDDAGEKWKEALEKGDEEEAYRQARSSTRVDETIIKTSKELLDLMGIPYVQSAGEGESQAAFMVQRGDALYAVSQDYDTLLFGAPLLVRNLTVSGKRKIRGRVISVNPERIVLDEVTCRPETDPGGIDPSGNPCRYRLQPGD